MSGKDAYDIDLLQSLTGELLRLPQDAVIEVGPAAQTLAGILQLTGKETFAAMSEIAIKARLPAATCRKHLETLEAHGWIFNAGREKTRSGVPRRTNTIRITAKTTKAKESWWPLPWWACCCYRNRPPMTWSEKLVLGVVLRRLAQLRAVTLCQPDPEDSWDGIEGVTGIDGRFRFSVDELIKQTGLARQSVIGAKPLLAQRKVIIWTGDRDGRATDSLEPNSAFRARVESAGDGFCRVSLVTV